MSQASSTSAVYQATIAKAKVETKASVHTTADLPHTGTVSSLSLRLLMAKVQKPRPIPDLQIIAATEQARCQRHGDHFRYNPERTSRARIFAGGLIADDSWHAIGGHAIETYGVYHSVTFVESNRTQSGEARNMRFTAGSEELNVLQSGIFGPNTPVYLENFIHEDKQKKIPRLIREQMMRQVLLRKWKELGMRKDDLGLIFDVDEIPSRDGLRTVQICDPSSDRWSWSSTNPTCKSPMVRFGIPMFEGSPRCMHRGQTKDRVKRFMRIDIVIGACIEGISTSSSHPPAPRNFVDKYGVHHGGRKQGYGEKLDYSQMPNDHDGHYPLYNAADFRRMQGYLMYGGLGYHLHNFFVSPELLRFKHFTYGHRHDYAYDVPLGAMNADLNLLVKCAHNISDQGNRKQRLENGLDFFAKA